jgi:hypothetical protein
MTKSRFKVTTFGSNTKLNHYLSQNLKLIGRCKFNQHFYGHPHLWLALVVPSHTLSVLRGALRFLIKLLLLIKKKKKKVTLMFELKLPFNM